jgi:hypothetical protein
MKNMLKECEQGRWKPEDGDIFYYIDTYCRVIKEQWADTPTDKIYYKKDNCFKTREQAETEIEKILVCRQLENIAKRLNRGQEIDWFNDNQYKYSLHFNFLLDKICITFNACNKEQGSVYCLDKDFLNTAIKEIGEERLITYLRGE